MLQTVWLTPGLSLGAKGCPDMVSARWEVYRHVYSPASNSLVFLVESLGW